MLKILLHFSYFTQFEAKVIAYQTWHSWNNQT
jgi:hypothetical protein